MQLILWLFITFAWGNEHAQLARRYAPSIMQEIGSHPSADEFTRVDFDNDFNALNNWTNLDLFPRPREAYYAIIESDFHFFITYGFFFPRDYADFCFFMHCHENDFEGMRVVIKKPHHVVALETLAHNYRTVIKTPKTIEIMIERGGHGLYPITTQAPTGTSKLYPPESYHLRPLLELWEKRQSELFRKNGHFNGEKWIVFGLGAAKPAWWWEIWNSDLRPGEWFLDPLKEYGVKGEKYLHHPYQNP